MPLHILIPMVVIGIAGITVLLHLLGLTSRVSFADENAARAAWLREFPEDMPDQITLSRNRHAALLQTRRGCGLVWAMGADTTARYVRCAAITRTRGGLRLDLRDFGAAHVHLTLDPEEAETWPALIKGTL